MKQTLRFVFVFLLLTNLAFAYQLVLKNGKVIQGTLIIEDDEKITLQDKDGVSLTFKKNSVDLEKTTIANKPPEEPAIAPVEEPKKAPPVESKPKPKTPAKVYTANDLYRLRGEYPMDNTGADIQGSIPEGDGQKMTGEQWQQLTQNLLNQMKQAEQIAQEASAKCKEFQGATIQTHIAIDQQNQQVDMVEATKQACQAATDAKAQAGAAQQEYENAVEQARQESVLPGYITKEE